MNINPNIRIFLLSLIFLTLNLQCEENHDDYFPYTEVDLILDINSDLVDLGSNESKIFSKEEYGQGYGGIILFKNAFGDYRAFDMACPHDIPDVCVVERENSADWVLECPCCSSAFNLLNGAFPEGDSPARHSLREYNAYVNGNWLVISN